MSTTAFLFLPLNDPGSDFVPSDDMLLEKIRAIQKTHGARIGLQKTYDYIKAENPLWMVRPKRLRTIRKNHNLACPPTSKDPTGSGSANANNNSNAPGHRAGGTTTSNTQRTRDSEPSLTMRLTFNVIANGRNMFVYTFMRPLPRRFCETGNNASEREAAFAFVNRLIYDCEWEIIHTQAWKCTYCGERATCIYSSPFVDFNTRPPSVVSYGSVPICVVPSRCHGLAHTASLEELNDQQANGTMPKPSSEEDWVFHHNIPALRPGP